MRRLPSQRELVATLIACAESEGGDEELEQLLVNHLPALAETLGTSQEWLQATCRLPEEERRARIRSLVKGARERGNVAHAVAMQNLALGAGGMLTRLGRWREDRVELDARIVLGTLLADRSKRFLSFKVEGHEPIVVTRAKLREAARALRFPDLTCFLDERGLQFRWRGGVGGLVLTAQSVSSLDHDAILEILLTRPRPELRERHHRPEPIRRAPTWIGEFISDLGFL